jgi:hypothetical protein
MSMKYVWAGAIAMLVALGGAVTVFAAQPSPKPHGKPSPSPSVQQVAAPSPSPSEQPVEQPSPEPSDAPDTSAGNNAGGNSGTHPCNHGWYVSQAAHKHAGGAYVSSVAQSDLGKNGTCTAPLPSPPA